MADLGKGTVEQQTAQVARSMTEDGRVFTLASSIHRKVPQR
jgi:hypothetical protein